MSATTENDGEFEGALAGARDHLIYRFRNAILDARLRGYALALPAPDEERLLYGTNLAAWGDARRFSVTNCILTTLAWAEAESVETEVAFVFDNHPGAHRRQSARISIYQHYTKTVRPTPKPVGMHSQLRKDAAGLQAADMYAWECYR